MHPALRKGSLFFTKKPVFHFFYKTPSILHFFNKNIPIFHFLQKTHPTFHFLPTGLHPQLFWKKSVKIITFLYRTVCLTIT